MKFKSIHKISVIQETFLVFFNLRRGPDKTPSGAGPGPRVLHPWYNLQWQIVSIISVGLYLVKLNFCNFHIYILILIS